MFYDILLQPEAEPTGDKVSRKTLHRRSNSAGTFVIQQVINFLVTLLFVFSQCVV